MRVLLTGTLAAGLLIGAGCTQKVVIQPATSTSSVAPGLVVERFLRSANTAAANDTAGIIEMGRLMGTRKGPVIDQWPRDEVQQRMFLTAAILKHDDYKVLGEQLVPGRMNEARQINVELTMGPRKVTVPFTMVRAQRDSWLVEEIALANITSKR